MFFKIKNFKREYPMRKETIYAAKAVVGSSAIKNSGSQHNESEITTLCLIPPEN